MTVLRRTLCVLLVAVAAGCAGVSPRYADVVSMSAQEGAGTRGHPPPGTVWRLDANDLERLSPAPLVQGPPPPRLPPPPRPNDPPRPIYDWPVYGPAFPHGPYWPGPSLHYWGRW